MFARRDLGRSISPMTLDYRFMLDNVGCTPQRKCPLRFKLYIDVLMGK